MQVWSGPRVAVVHDHCGMQCLLCVSLHSVCHHTLCVTALVCHCTLCVTALCVSLHLCVAALCVSLHSVCHRTLCCVYCRRKSPENLRQTSSFLARRFLSPSLGHSDRMYNYWFYVSHNWPLHMTAISICLFCVP